MTTDTSFMFQNGTLRSISREDMAILPIRRYEGRLSLVSTPQAFEEACGDILKETVVGLDTETRPAFAKGESYAPCLVQVATEHAVYLFQLRHPESHPILQELLENPQIVKSGIALAHDLRMLKTVFTFEQRNVLDLGTVARRSGCSQTGLRNLAGLFLDFRIPKGARTSNWAAQNLSTQQLTYAATDAWACRELFLRFEILGLLEA